MVSPPPWTDVNLVVNPVASKGGGGLDPAESACITESPKNQRRVHIRNIGVHGCTLKKNL